MTQRSNKFGRLMLITWAFLLGINTAVYADDKQIVGWVEKVRIVPEGLKVKAKLDTGAQNSSLHAVQAEEFGRQGEKWVRFDLTNWQNRTATLEKKVIRTARIKEHDRASRERLVIYLGICLGRVYKEVEVNLVDRSHFKYQMLVGRSFLMESFVVDPALMFTVEPHCSWGAKP